MAAKAAPATDTRRLEPTRRGSHRNRKQAASCATHFRQAAHSYCGPLFVAILNAVLDSKGNTFPGCLVQILATGSTVCARNALATACRDIAPRFGSDIKHSSFMPARAALGASMVCLSGALYGRLRMIPSVRSGVSTPDTDPGQSCRSTQRVTRRRLCAVH